MTLNRFDVIIVENLRRQQGALLEEFTDQQIADGWKMFIQSAEYPDMAKFRDWCRTVES